MNKVLVITGLTLALRDIFNLVTELVIENVEFTDFIMPALDIVLFVGLTIIINLFFKDKLNG